MFEIKRPRIALSRSAATISRIGAEAMVVQLRAVRTNDAERRRANGDDDRGWRGVGVRRAPGVSLHFDQPFRDRMPVRLAQGPFSRKLTDLQRITAHQFQFHNAIVVRWCVQLSVRTD